MTWGSLHEIIAIMCLLESESSYNYSSLWVAEGVFAIGWKIVHEISHGRLSHFINIDIFALSLIYLITQRSSYESNLQFSIWSPVLSWIFTGFLSTVCEAYVVVLFLKTKINDLCFSTFATL